MPSTAAKIKPGWGLVRARSAEAEEVSASNGGRVPASLGGTAGRQTAAPLPKPERCLAGDDDDCEDGSNLL